MAEKAACMSLPFHHNHLYYQLQSVIITNNFSFIKHHSFIINLQHNIDQTNGFNHKYVDFLINKSTRSSTCSPTLLSTYGFAHHGPLPWARIIAQHHKSSWDNRAQQAISASITKKTYSICDQTDTKLQRCKSSRNHRFPISGEPLRIWVHHTSINSSCSN